MLFLNYPIRIAAFFIFSYYVAYYVASGKNSKMAPILE